MLLSVFVLRGADVSTFGAAGNGIVNDTAAVQSAINACGSNGTVTFTGGSYLVSGLALKSNCTLAGSGGAAIILATANSFIADISQLTNVRITGLTLNSNGLGGGIIAQGYAPAQNIQIDHCVFRNVPATAIFPANLSLVSTWGFVNSTIQNNTFANVAGGIWLTTVENTGILNNSFQNVTEGDAIYVAPNPASFPSGDNLVITGNAGSGLARIGIELFRPDPPNGSVLTAPVVQNNSFSNWTSPSGMGLSITHGDGAIVSGNKITNATGPWQNAGIEIIVAHAQVTNNVIAGNFTEGISIVGTSSPTVTGNIVSGAGDTGIILACDVARDRCSSTNSVISGNTVVEPQLIGIKLDNDWSNSLISRNTIVRTAGSWPADNTVIFAGIHQSPAPGPGVIDSNVVIQQGITWPGGFWFCGVDVNSSMPGSSITNNTVRSDTPYNFGSGLIDNTGSALTGWIVSGNTYQNLWMAVNW